MQEGLQQPWVCGELGVAPSPGREEGQHPGGTVRVGLERGRGEGPGTAPLSQMLPARLCWPLCVPPEPQITSPPYDAWNVTGQDVVFGCEVFAYPMASIEWRKDGTEMLLPGDDPHISVQVGALPSPPNASGSF